MQSKIKKTALATALATALTGGALMSVSTAVQAVNIAQDGLGEALEFSYYTVRSGWSTLFNITNTSNETVIIKVRWREALNSREARDFIVVLSPYDVWTVVTREGENGPEIITADNSCTFPKLESVNSTGDAFGNGLTGVEFTNLAYTRDTSGARVVDNRDWSSRVPPSIGGGLNMADIDRTREGYFEVFNMGSIHNNSQNLVADAATIARFAKHEEEVGNNQAVPRDCSLVRSVLRNRSPAVINNFLTEPKNVLKGRAVLVASESGIAAGYDPLTLADFSVVPIYGLPTSVLPSLASANPAIATVINDGQVVGVPGFTGRFGTGNIQPTATASAALGVNAVLSPIPAGAGADAVSALISRSNLINDYNAKGDSATSWIVGFPTKNFYVDRAIYPSNTMAQIPFADPNAPYAPFRGIAPVFNGTNRGGGSCLNFRLSMWDREEYNVVADQFSPPLSPSIGGMCNEVNVLSFGRGNNPLGSSTIHRTVVGGDNKGSLPADNGWAVLGFGGNPALNGTTSNAGGLIRNSLPVIGMRVEVRNRGDATVNFGLANEVTYIGDRTQPQLGLSQAVTTQVLQ